MNIRPYQTGDDAAQLQIYNTAAAALPKFKPATLLDIQRRTTAKDFDRASRLFAVAQDNQVVGYCSFQANGRVGYPWCLPGYENAAEPLFAQTIQAMKQHGIAKAYCAYRKDWAAINEFFQKHEFNFVREIVNFVLAFENMPTPSARLSNTVTAAVVEDIPGIFALDPTVFRVSNAETLKEALWHNPYFSPDSLFVVRDRGDGAPLAAGIFITDERFADPRQVDASMPCFRLGAFGSEGMTAKRIKGLFSFVARPDRNIFSMGMDLLGYASAQLRNEDDIACYAAQCASDATALFTFYQRTFERQGSFPIHERDLTK